MNAATLQTLDFMAIDHACQFDRPRRRVPNADRIWIDTHLIILPRIILPSFP